VLYERRTATSLADLAPGLLAPCGEALFADPRRKDAPLFLDLMAEKGFTTSTQSAMVPQGGREVKVLVHRFRR
jgi:hypothetical protein